MPKKPQLPQIFFLAVATLLLLTSANLMAQQTEMDTLGENTTASVVNDRPDPKPDSIIAKPTERHSPKKAALMSGLLPGLGQAYNKKYWKIPIIYGGFAGLGYATGINAKRYRTYRDAYSIVVNSDSISYYNVSGNDYTESQLNDLKNYYKRNRDLSIIFTGVLYFLNVIDAVVDAHLFEFDISDDLSLRIEPAMNLNLSGTGFAGIRLNLQL